MLSRKSYGMLVPDCCEEACHGYCGDASAGWGPGGI